jgi:hypothetical protein
MHVVIVMAGVAIGVSSGLLVGSPSALAAPADEQKADLTPKLKAGDSFAFKQHIIRSETQSVANVPKTAETAPAKDDAAKPGEGSKDDSNKDGAKKDEPKKDDAKKDEPKKSETQVIKQTWSIDQTATYELRVTSAAEAGIMMELELKGIVASAELPGGKATWNSDQPPDDKDMSNPLITTYKPLIGAVAKISMSNDGNITQVLPDPRVNLGRQNGPLAPMVQLMCSPNMVKFRWGPIIWPKDGREPATVGTAWKNVEEVPNPAIGRFVYTTTNTVKSVKDNMAQMDFTGEIGLVPLENMKSTPGTISEQMVKGTVLFDTKFGLIKSQTWQEKTLLDVNAMGFPVKRELKLDCTTTRE